MTRKFGWSKNVLIHQIENQSYEKTLLGQTNFDKALAPAQRAPAKLAVKDEYTFDFLELGEEYAERELERALVARIEVFLRAMGGLFAFVGSQYRLEVDDKEYFIDLLLFHRRLKCLVAVELKVGEFEPEFVGKMQFYLAALDDRAREEGENPSIGIILCKEKRRTIVEYALRDARRPIGVATYRIVRRLPQRTPGPASVAGADRQALGRSRLKPGTEMCALRPVCPGKGRKDLLGVWQWIPFDGPYGYHGMRTGKKSSRVCMLPSIDSLWSPGKDRKALYRPSVWYRAHRGSTGHRAGASGGNDAMSESNRKRLETTAIIVGYAMSRLDDRYLRSQGVRTWKAAFDRAAKALRVRPRV